MQTAFIFFTAPFPLPHPPTGIDCCYVIIPLETFKTFFSLSIRLGRSSSPRDWTSLAARNWEKTQQPQAYGTCFMANNKQPASGCSGTCLILTQTQEASYQTVASALRKITVHLCSVYRKNALSLPLHRITENGSLTPSYSHQSPHSV